MGVALHTHGTGTYWTLTTSEVNTVNGIAPAKMSADVAYEFEWMTCGVSKLPPSFWPPSA